MIDMESSSLEHNGDSHLYSSEARKYGTMEDQNPPGLAPRVAYFHQAPQDHMTSAILTTIFCFFPLGCLAIFYSSRARDCYSNRKLLAASKAAENSKLMSQMAFVIGMVIYIAGTITLLVKLGGVI